MITPPRPFQVKGVRFVDQAGGRAIIGDDMGLGKTYQTIAYLAINPAARPAIIVCPATLKIQWMRELLKHAGIKSSIVEGKGGGDLSPLYPVLIFNYDILASWAKSILAIRPRVLVMDECQKIKNPRAKRTKACKGISARCRHVIPLSGTPILNRPAEFFSVLNMVAPKEFKSFWDYGFRYCNPKRGWGGQWDFTGASHTRELRNRIAPFMIRRLKEEVLVDLPARTRSIIPMVLANMREYEKAADDFIGWVTEAKGPAFAKRARGAVALTRLNALMSLIGEGKIKTIIRWIEDWLEARPDGKLVMFGTHISPLQAGAKAICGAGLIYGAVKPKDRQGIIDNFQNNKQCRVLFGQIEALGIGANLTASDTVGFMELAWAPAHHDQAEDRVRRMGQTSKHVDAFYFIGADTIEEPHLKMLSKKRNVLGSILDGDAAIDGSMNVIKYLLERKDKKK